jgi:hypothetical protein
MVAPRLELVFGQHRLRERDCPRHRCLDLATHDESAAQRCAFPAAHRGEQAVIEEVQIHRDVRPQARPGSSDRAFHPPDPADTVVEDQQAQFRSMDDVKHHVVVPKQVEALKVPQRRCRELDDPARTISYFNTHAF